MDKKQTTVVLVLVLTFVILGGLAFLLYKVFANGNKLEEDFASMNTALDTLKKTTSDLEDASDKFQKTLDNATNNSTNNVDRLKGTEKKVTTDGGSYTSKKLAAVDMQQYVGKTITSSNMDMLSKANENTNQVLDLINKK